MQNIFIDKKHASYIPVIDGLRAVAILSVIIVHSVFHWPWVIKYPFIADVMKKILFYTGVPLFFIISGFCIISQILLKYQKTQDIPQVGTFLKHRFRRIYPPYFVCFLIFLGKVLFVDAYLKDQPLNVDEIKYMVLYNVFMLQIISGDTMVVNPGFWTLCVEAQFYVLVALIMLSASISRLGINLGWIVFGLVSFISIFMNIAVQLGTLSIDSRVWFMSIFRAWPLFVFGGGLAWLRLKQNQTLWHCLIAIGIVILTLANNPQTALIVLMFWLALPWQWNTNIVTARYWQAMLSSRPALFIGRISYSTYLMHGLGIAFLSGFVGRLFITTPLLGIIGAIGLYTFTLLISYLYYRAVESHFLRSVEPKAA